MLEDDIAGAMKNTLKKMVVSNRGRDGEKRRRKKQTGVIKRVGEGKKNNVMEGEGERTQSVREKVQSDREREKLR